MRGPLRILPPQAELLNLLSYDPETGDLRWHARGLKWFDARYAGKRAFTAIAHGYYRGSIHGRMFSAHRVAYKIFHGVDAGGPIDHINGDRSDNRIANLRLATALLNLRNASIPNHNTSGMVGVSYRPEKRRWRAHITIGNRQKHLGYFHSREAAVSARLNAEDAEGFADNGRRGQ